LILLEVKTEAQRSGLTRPGYDLCIVLDRSGSMVGDKLEHSKQAILAIIENMLPADRLSLVVYDDEVNSVFSALTILSSQKMKDDVRAITSGGSTNLYGGLKMGIDILSNQPADGLMRRVFLFSDGLANAGTTSRDSIFSLAANARSFQITTSSFGIGADFDEKIMAGIAEKGQGDYFFIQGSESIGKLVARGLQGFTSLLGTETQVTLKGLNGATVTKVYSHSTTDVLSLGDLRELDSRKLLIELDVSQVVPAVSREDEKLAILSWEVNYNSVKSKGKIILSGVVAIRGINDDSSVIKQYRDEFVWAFKALKTAEERDSEILNLMAAGRFDEAINSKEETIRDLNEIPMSLRSHEQHIQMRRHADSYQAMKSSSMPASAKVKYVQYHNHLNAESSTFKDDL